MSRFKKIINFQNGGIKKRTQFKKLELFWESEK